MGMYTKIVFPWHMIKIYIILSVRQQQINRDGGHFE